MAAIREIGDLTLRLAPCGSSQSQGSVERFHETLDGQGRAVKLHVELAYKITLSGFDPIMALIVRHACWLLNRYLIGSDGLTAYQRRWNQNFQQALCEFSETVLYMIPSREQSNKGLKQKIEYRWDEGIWLGRCTESSETLIGSAEGVLRCRSIRRLPESDRYMLEVFKAFSATPWNPKNDGKFYPEFILPDVRSGESKSSQEAEAEDGLEYMLQSLFLQPLLDGNRMNPHKGFLLC